WAQGQARLAGDADHRPLQPEHDDDARRRRRDADHAAREPGRDGRAPRMRIAVLSGGRSSEHDVSLASGESVRAGLAEAGHDVLDVRIARDGTWALDGEPVALEPGRGLLGADCVFPALHGPFGEDGTVQGLLELLDVPYAGAGVLASALCMDKVLFKDVMAQAGVPQVRYAALHDGQAVTLDGLGLPVFVKPARLGSSVGI